MYFNKEEIKSPLYFRKEKKQMTQYIQNKNNCLILYYTDKNNKLQSTKISNYSIQGLFTLKEVTNTKNSYKITEKFAL